MGVIITKKVDVKMKSIHFEDGTLVDQDGVIVDLINDLKAVYGDKDFDLSATFTKKDEHEVSDFKEND